MSVRSLFAKLTDSSAADADLLDRFRRTRDEAAFAALVRRHGPMVWGVCRRVVGDAHAAEDAFQAAFLVLVMRANDAGRRGEIGGWLYGVAVRTALKARRTARRLAARERTNADAPEPVAKPEPAADWLPVLDEELAVLVEKYRLPVLLCDVQGMTLRAAAERLGVPVGTLSERLTKGRGTLAGRLARRGVGPAVVAVGVVELPAGLAAATVQQAVLVACGGAVAPAAFGLSYGVARAMWFSKLKGLAAVAAVAVVGAGTVGIGGWLAAADPPAKPAKPVAAKPMAADDWAARFEAVNDDNWRAAYALGEEVADLQPEQGWAILRDNWSRVRTTDARQQLVKAWYYTGPYPLTVRKHPHLLEVLHLGMTDPSPKVQSYALTYLKDVALRDFAADGGYAEWSAATTGKPLAEVTAAAAGEAVRGLLAAPPADAAKRLAFLAEHAGHFADWPESRKAAAVAGLSPALRRWVAEGRTEPVRGRANQAGSTAAAAVRLLAALGQSEADAKADFLPLLDPAVPSDMRSAAVRALGREKYKWAVGPLCDRLIAEAKAGATDRGLVWELATALADIGDQRAIPTMIAVIDSEGGYNTVYGVGWFGLHPLTNVDYNDSHDGKWWRAWWEKNKGRLPAEVQALAIPDLPKVVKKTEPAADNDPLADVKDVPNLVRLAAGQKYLLIGKTDAPPAGGYKLLVTLPGGDGSEEFNPFVRRIQKNALGDGWLIAQAVAPTRVVWPTEKLNPAAEPTEKYLAAVVADASGKAKIDPTHVYLFGWSSGGPACYAALLKDGSPFRGAFVAMSVFKPDLLPPLAGAKGKPVYLLQSPDDQVTALRWAEAAEKELTAAGAKVKLQKYDGGHGWHGDMFENIRAGVGWLTR